MQKLSTGQDSTLENWIAMATAVFGAASPAVDFLKKKAKESPNGYKEEVIANEAQLLFVLMSIHAGEGEPVE